MNFLITQQRINSLVKIQFISGHFPTENTNGCDAYVLDFLRYLRQSGCELEYVSIEPSHGSMPWFIIPASLGKPSMWVVRNYLRIGRVLLRFNSLSDWVRGLLWLLYRRLPQQFQNIYHKFRATVKKLKPTREQQCTNTNSEDQDWLALLTTSKDVAFAKTQLDRFKPDVVVVNYVFLANILDAFSPEQPGLKVILTHDVFYKRLASFKEKGIPLNVGNWDLETEAAQLSKAQVILAIQEEDAKVLKQMASQCEVISMPKAAVLHQHTVKQVPGRCLFVGSGANHNYLGLQWFLDNVWQIIIQQVTDSSLHVCGSVCEAIQGTFPNVDLLGQVDDLKPEYGAAEVCLVPLLAGSGLKIKLVEAMSYSRACVSTSVGVQGLGDIVDKTALVADTAEDFAAAVQTLLTNSDKRKWMEEQVHKYVNEKLSPQAAYQPFVDYIHQYLQRVPSKSQICPMA